MHRSGAQLVRYALEQLNTEQTFGVVGDLNRAIYSELQQSSIHTHLVNRRSVRHLWPMPSAAPPRAKPWVPC